MERARKSASGGRLVALIAFFTLTLYGSQNDILATPPAAAPPIAAPPAAALPDASSSSGPTAEAPSQHPPARSAAAAPIPASPRFREVTASLGLSHQHQHYGDGEKYMPENMGPGLALFDANGDGRLDLYLPQGAPVAAGEAPEGYGNRLFLQGADGRFQDHTDRAEVGHRGVGMGAVFGDVDGDGDLDLYLSNYGPDLLYRNRGDGTFEDATAEAGLGSPLWSTGATFVDGDGDGDLDLYVVAYVDFALDRHEWCGNAQQKLRAYCHPDVYGALPDRYYRNDGKGRFVSIGPEVGILPTPDGKGLGVMAADFDGDGNQDIFVANDSTMNLLYLGDGRGKFREEALLAGVGFNGSGAAEASMGIEWADLDGDQRPELFLTHLDQETNTLYGNEGQGLFRDITEAVGLGRPGLPWVGFGTVAFDHDHDGDQDLLVANGHIIDNIQDFDSSRRHAQPLQLFDNGLVSSTPGHDSAGRSRRPRASRFAELSDELGLARPLVARGAVAGDLDRDGDLDLMVAQNDGPLVVLENLHDRDSGRSLMVRLRGKASNPQGYGAVLELRIGKQLQVRTMKAATSYLSQGPPEVHFGLGQAKQAAELVVRWPSGQVDRHRNLDAGWLYLLSEGEAARERQAFTDH